MPYCKEEKIFIHNYLSSQSKNYVFYAFNSQSAQNAVHFTTSLHQDNNSLLTKIQTISSYVNASIGVISSNLLHQICGPYPTFSELYTDTLDDIVHTYLLPVLMIFVLITNFFVCLVLSRPHMRSPVFFLLFLIGIVELTNCCLPLPMYFAQSVYKRTAWWTDLPMRNFTSAINSLSGTDWELAPSDYYQTSDNVIASEASAWTTVFLPTITHTMSVWLTVALAIQRVINLTTNNIASKICNLTSTGRVFILILIISFILHWPLLSSRFILFQPIQLKSSIVENNLRVTNTTNSVQCLLNVVDNLPGIVMKCHLLQPVYMIFYFYARIVLIHILPCGILITLTIILVLKMHNIIKLRARLGLKNKNISYNSNQCKCKLFSCVCKKLNSTKESTSRVTSIPCKGNDSEIIRASYPKKSSVNPQAISRMLIVVLIKFIAMHLPNAIVLTIYAVRRMFKAENLMPNNNKDTTTTEDVFHEMHSKQITFTYAHNYTIHTSINLLESSENVKLNATNNDIIDDYLGKAVILCNLVILVSYQLNFAIYYIMSTQFKETFNSLCCNKRFTLNRN